jgi:DNA-binding NarL/FixJ family response regulator
VTPRQQHVLRLIADGLATKEIASVLDVSDTAVKKQIAALCKKVGARNRASLVRQAIAFGLIDS